MAQNTEILTPEDNTFKAFERIISRHRFQRYRRATSSKQEAVALYLWNVALCEALYPSLQFFEVSLRNATHASMTQHYSSSSRWFMDMAILREEIHQRQVWQAISEVRKKGKGHFIGDDTDPQFPKEPQRIVAELSLGFWVNLYSGPYTALIVASVMPRAFPNAPKEIVIDKRQDIIYPRLKEILDLRNRVFHHEPIYHWTFIQDNSSLMRRHERLCEVISWMCQVQPFFLEAIDHFNHVCSAGRKSIQEATEFAFLQDAD